MNADSRRQPADFLDEVQEIRARRAQRDASPTNRALADQMQAAGQHARRIMGQLEGVIDGDRGDREGALLLALDASAGRRGLQVAGHDSPRPELVDLFATGRPGHCDVCDTRAHRLEEMHAQYGPMIFRGRVCVRCRRFGPAEPVDGNPDAA